MRQRIVSVYGGGATQPGESVYEEGILLGRLLAGAGYAVVTGGYGGVMEAACKGAKEVGGFTIGVTFESFHAKGLQPNPYIDEQINYKVFSDRLLHIVEKADANVALGGGLGTLSEVSLTWSLLQVGQLPSRPFLLLGESWQGIIQQLYAAGSFIREQDMNLLQVVRTPSQIITHLRDWETQTF